MYSLYIITPLLFIPYFEQIALIVNAVLNIKTLELVLKAVLVHLQLVTLSSFLVLCM